MTGRMESVFKEGAVGLRFEPTASCPESSALISAFESKPVPLIFMHACATMIALIHLTIFIGQPSVTREEETTFLSKQIPQPATSNHHKKAVRTESQPLKRESVDCRLLKLCSISNLGFKIDTVARVLS